MEYLLIAITPKSTLTQSGGTYYYPIYGSFKNLFLVDQTVSKKQTKTFKKQVHEKCKYEGTINAIPEPLSIYIFFFFW